MENTICKCSASKPINSHFGMIFCRSFCWTAIVQRGDFCDAP